MTKTGSKTVRFVHYRTVQKLAALMVPFYKTIAGNHDYAARWSKAVIATDVQRMERMLAAVSPKTEGLPLASNGIGYFVSIPAGIRDIQLTNGTTIPPGTVQFTFETRIHRAIARAVLPLYRELARNCGFARALARAIRTNDAKTVRMMVRSLVRTSALRSVNVDVEDGGLALNFKYRSSKYIYRNLLFRETD
ncbi:hypothetical protein [Paenibacillus thermotolerans]|uniref:hypothetical protein n=1 Tax=Paenibacillus thermotolerans TaxID=3027807 RepID=UPI00236884C0|nr:MULTISPECIES: hypothetical protein [unclassified Paenibacillus]